jgi:quinol-cytochrome oxidoreductase complex cytochrome b subunit
MTQSNIKVKEILQKLVRSTGSYNIHNAHVLPVRDFMTRTRQHPRSKFISQNSFFKLGKNHMLKYPTPSSLSNLWGVGSQVGLFFFLQVVTGIILAMHYTPHTSQAFDSVVHIMRDVKFGWFFRYAHANGASFIFMLLYIHTARALYYQSYLTKPAV